MTAGPLSPVREPREGERLLGDGPSAADHRWDAHRHDAEVGLEHHIWVENRHKRREVAITRGSEERVNDCSLAGQISIGDLRPSHPAPCAAGELPCRDRGTPHDGSDLLEGHREHVVQHERQPLGGR